MKWIVLTIFSFFMFSGVVGCTQIEEPNSPSTIIESESADDSRSAKTRSMELPNTDREFNPYSQINLQTAYDKLKNDLGLPAMYIRASHIYGRFFVQDTVQLSILSDSLKLELFDYPLDNPDISDSDIDEYMNNIGEEYWQYAVVPVGFVFPSDIAYQFIDSLYMQKETETRADSENAIFDDNVYDLIVEESMLNCGLSVAPETRGSKWEPSAEIYYKEDRNNSEIPLHGVKIRCSHGVNVGHGFTNASGYVGGIKGWGGKFRYKVRYKIKWEDSRWNIRNGRTGQAKYKGPYQRGHWWHVIKNDTKQETFAAVHRALHAFYYESHPLTNGITKMHPYYYPVMNVGVITDRSGKDNGYFLGSFLRNYGVNSIVVWLNNRDKWKVTATMFHELGHANHYQASLLSDGGAFDWISYFAANGAICESWANGVRYAYMQSLYPGIELTYQNDPQYTAIVESLMNQGLTLQQLQNTVVGKTKWEQWRTAVKALGIIPNQIVDMLFDNPNSVVRTNISKISGPADPGLNTTATYTVPTGNVLPSGMSFEGFTIQRFGFGYTILNDSGGSLRLQLGASFSFTINATYTLPDGSKYTCSKIVERTAKAPVLLESKKYYDVGGIGGGYMIISVYVANPQAGVTYEWERTGAILYGTSIVVPPNLTPYGQDYVTIVKCRATLNGTISPWVEYCVVYPFGTFSAPISVMGAGEGSGQDSTETSGETSDETNSQAGE